MPSAKKTKAKPVRLLCYGDTHCGHVGGLTHPDFWQNAREPWGKNQRTLWKWFAAKIREFGPFDLAVHNGDALDGPGKKSGGSEQIHTSEAKQIEMAEAVIRFVNAGQNVQILGTGYHVGNRNDWERVLAQRLGIPCAAELFLTVNGKTFNFKHHTGRPSVIHGMHAVVKERSWDVLNHYDHGHKKRPAEIYVRSHIHMTREASKADIWKTVVLPALEWPGSKFGRRCSGDYDMGFLAATINEDGKVTEWDYAIARPEDHGPEFLELTF